MKRAYRLVRKDSMQFHRRVWAATKFAAGATVMQRSFEVLPDDCMLVSYPRSGSTWLRFLVSNARFGRDEPTTFENLNQRIPYALRPSPFTMKRLTRPRILKSHSAYDCRFRKVVLLVRDPRDVAISYYHYHIRRAKISADCSLDEYVPKYVWGEMDRYGNWGENVGSWLGARAQTEDFMLVRYEDMKENTASSLKSICEFLELPSDNQTIQHAVHWSSPEKMNPRKATPGEWRDVLAAESVELIERSWGTVMTQLGYEVSHISRLEHDRRHVPALAG